MNVLFSELILFFTKYTVEILMVVFIKFQELSTDTSQGCYKNVKHQKNDSFSYNNITKGWVGNHVQEF